MLAIIAGNSDINAKEAIVGFLIFIIVTLMVVNGHYRTQMPDFKWNDDPPTLFGVLGFFANLAVILLINIINDDYLKPRLIQFFPQKSIQLFIIEMLILLPPLLMIGYAFERIKKFIEGSKKS